MKPVIVFTVDDIVWLAIVGICIVVLAVLAIYGALGRLYDSMAEWHQRRLAKHRAKKAARDLKKRVFKRGKHVRKSD